MTGTLTLRPRHRLVLDNDWAGDPDGLVALAHHLLSSDRVVAVTSSLIPPEFPGSADGARRGAALARELVDLVGGEVAVVAAGAERPGAEETASDAARVIAEEAQRDDALPLVVVCAGPLTNVAEALRRWPGIASRFRLVWVGGSTRGAWEYNEQTDPEAARAVFSVHELRIEQVPLETYECTAVSLAELHDAFHRSTVGRWLWSRFVELPLPPGVTLGEVWHLGDSLPLQVTTLRPPFAAEPGSREIVDRADIRLLWADLRAKLRAHDLLQARG